MKHTIDLHTPELQRTFWEMILLEELVDEYNAETIDRLATNGETAFPDDPFFKVVRAYPLIREGELDRAKRLVDEASLLGDHPLIHLMNGHISEESGFTFEAEQHFLRAVERYPDVPMPRRALAIHYFNRKFYGESGLHLLHYVRLAGFADDTVSMLLEFFQVFDDVPLEMNEELTRVALNYLFAHPHDPRAHSLYAQLCSSRVSALTGQLNEGEPLTDEMIGLLLEVEDHGMWSATYDHSSDKVFRTMFKEYVDNVILPNTSRYYVTHLQIRYWIRRLTYRFTGGYSIHSN